MKAPAARVLATVATLFVAGLLTAATASPLALKGAVIGMTIGEWGALAPPAGEGANAFPTCWGLDSAGRIARRPLTATVRPTDVTVCAYDARYGDSWSTHSFYLDMGAPMFRAHSVHYVFTGGRLSEIDFRAAVSARPVVEAFVRRQCGAPAQVVSAHGRLIESWRAGPDEVTLSDPSADPVDLSVRMAGPGAPSAAFLRSAFARPGSG